MAKSRLTDLGVSRLKAADRDYDIWDSDTSGFGVRVYKSRAKSFFFYYRLDERKRRMMLGRYPDIGVGEAREKASKLRQRLARGEDPATEDKKGSVPFSEALELFLTEHCALNNKPSTIRSTTLLLRRDFEDEWRRKPVDKITRAHVVGVIRKIVQRGSPGAADKARAAISKFFSWCMSQGIVESSPVVGIKPVKRTEVGRRVLKDNEIGKVWNEATRAGMSFGPIVQLLLLSGQRRGEVAQMEWNEIAWEKRLWMLPPSRTKNRREHTVPLTNAMITILESVPERHDRFVFPSRANEETCFSGFGRCKALLDKELGFGDWKLHDLRRTVSTRLAEMGVMPHVIDCVLNHVSGGDISGVRRVYNTHRYLDEVRIALEGWEDLVLRLAAEQE